MTVATPMPIAHQLRENEYRREGISRTRDFVTVCMSLMIGGGPGRGAQLLRDARASEKLIEAARQAADPIVERAALDPLSLQSVGSILSPYQLLATSFLASLSSVSAFDSMLSSMPQFPIRSRVVSTTAAITGASLSEQSIKRVGSLALTQTDLDPSKAAAVIVISRELLLSGGAGTAAFLETQLRQAVALATDQQFITLITTGATSIPSSGANASGARQDIRSLLQAVVTGTASKLFLIVNPVVSKAWAVLGDNVGGAVFPDARVDGGSIGGVKIVPSDGCPQQTIVLADATSIAAASQGIRVDSSEQTMIDVGNPPDSPPAASTNPVNLWQTNMVGMLAERFFAAKVARPNAVATITNVNYTGGSPT